jgi:hypothetical protein
LLEFLIGHRSVPVEHASTLAFGRHQRTSAKPVLSRRSKSSAGANSWAGAPKNKSMSDFSTDVMCPSMTAFKPAALSCLRGRLQSPELKTRKLDGLFDLRSGKSVWGMLMGLDRTCRNPRSMVLRQFASRWVTGKCAQVGTCFRSKHIDEHNEAFRNAGLG